MKPFFNSPLKLIAEQGGCPDLPANSFDAFRSSIEKGADALSVFVRQTRDGKIIICEDEELSKFTDGQGRVRDHEFSELSTLDAAYHFRGGDNDDEYSYRGQGCRINLLEDVLNEFPDTRFIVNLMDNSLSSVKSFTDLVMKTKAEERLLVSSPHGKVIRFLAKQLPSVPVNFSLMGIVWIYALFRSGIINFFNHFSADAIITPENMGTSYIANRGLIKALKEKGCMVYVRVLAKEESVKRVLATKADGIVTDDIDFVRELMSL